LAEDDRNDQDARRGADREAEEFLAAKDGADRDRQQQENFRSCRNDPLDEIHSGVSPADSAEITENN